MLQQPRRPDEGEGDPYKKMCSAVCAWKQFMLCASRFGMTPSDRARLRSFIEDGGEPSGDALTQLLGERKAADG